jgi:hypothetical protein
MADDRASCIQNVFLSNTKVRNVLVLGSRRNILCRFFRNYLQFFAYSAQIAIIDLICIMTSQSLMPVRNAGLGNHRPGKLNSSKSPGPAFLAGIKPCDVTILKVYCKNFCAGN